MLTRDVQHQADAAAAVCNSKQHALADTDSSSHCGDAQQAHVLKLQLFSQVRHHTHTYTHKGSCAVLTPVCSFVLPTPTPTAPDGGFWLCQRGVVCHALPAC